MFDYEDLPKDLANPDAQVPALQEEQDEFWTLEEGGVELEVKVARPKSKDLVDGKAKYGILYLGGFPIKMFGGWRCTDPLVTEVVKHCQEAGLPTVRYNHRGYAKSKGWSPDETEESDPFKQNIYNCSQYRDQALMIKKMTETFCHQVVILAFSSATAGPLGRDQSAAICEVVRQQEEGKVAAYVSMNFGLRTMLMYESPDNVKGLKELVKEQGVRALFDHPAHQPAFEKLDVPALFVNGEQDWLTPKEDLEDFVKVVNTNRDAKRSPPASYVRIPGNHNFKGNESGCAAEIVNFLKKHLAIEAQSDTSMGA